ncbi:MAG: type II toxin-antitoxin system death-on-curing family toxin [Gemmatimonadaceae bacterium]
MKSLKVTEEPTWITEPILLGLHAQQIERYGGKHGVVDKNVVLSALARPRQRWAYDPDPDLADLAAAYLLGFARSQGFSDGNKRTGLACALVFLHINGAPLHAPPPELYALTMGAATGRADDRVASAYFRGILSDGNLAEY